MQKFLTITASIIVAGLVLAAIVGTFLMSYQARVRSDANTNDILKIVDYLKNKEAASQPKK